MERLKQIFIAILLVLSMAIGAVWVTAGQYFGTHTALVSADGGQEGGGGGGCGDSPDTNGPPVGIGGCNGPTPTPTELP